MMPKEQLRAIPNKKELKSWRFYHGEMMENDGYKCMSNPS